MRSSPSARFWPSAIYFLYFGSLAALMPFQALYYKSIGLSGGQIGLLLGVPPLVTLFAGPLWTGMADAKHWHKPIMLVTLTAVVVLMAVFPFFRTPLPLFALVLLYSFFVAPIISLTDSSTLAMLGEEKGKYGRIRLWGTVGWGLAAPIIGALLQKFGLQLGFWIYAAGMALVLLPAFQLVFTSVQSEKSFRQGMWTILSSRRWIFFLLIALVAGIGNAATNSYLSVLMESLGATKTMTGLSLTVSTLSELPVMFFSYLILRRMKPRGLFILAAAAMGVRSLLFFAIPSAVGIILVQLMHGLTFPALWLAGVTYAAENAPKGLSATAQGLFGSTLMGVGAAAGSLLGGVLMQRFSPAGMFGVIGGIVLAGLVFFLVLERLVVGGEASQT